MAPRRHLSAGGAKPPRARRAGRGAPPLLGFAGPSGSGKTRLLVRLVSLLTRRGLLVAVIKHTTHPHALDRRGKDTERFRRAGAVAAAIQGPDGMALFGPARPGARALAAMLPDVDLVLAEGFKTERLPRVEVHRGVVSREFLCVGDPCVVAVVTDEPAPRPLPSFGPEELERIAAFVCDWAGLALPAPRQAGRSTGGSGRRR